MLIATKSLLDRRSPHQASAIAIALVLAVAVGDYLTSDEISISVFYLVPIAIAAWHTPLWTALFVCCLSTLAWFDVEYMLGHRDSHGLITAWNALVRSGFFVTTALLVARTRDLMRKLERMARVDGLTGLLNARAFRETSRSLLQLATRHGHPTALGFLDLDNFKGVNDSAGHSVGDFVLRVVARTLSHSVRATDVIGRLGGDEFAILLPETDEAGARASFVKIHEALTRVARANDWPIGFSIGVALFPTGAADIDTALRIADGLTYAVKNNGKDGIAFSDDPTTEPTVIVPTRRRPAASERDRQIHAMLARRA